MTEATIGRRQLLEWAAASAALAACARAPERQIVPYVVQPNDVHPGRALHYATAWELDGYGMGLVVETRVGRPTKVEGNPKHPASLGATRAIDQALIASLYDPDRGKGIRGPSGFVNVDDFHDAFAHKRVAVLMPPTSSRSIEKIVGQLRRAGSDVSFHTALSRENPWRASQLATGSVVEPILDASRARVLALFGGDFLASGPSCVRDARGVADRRKSGGLRLYAIESRRTATGIFSDERLATTARERALVACAIAASVLGDAKSRASDAARALGQRLRARGAPKDERFVSACAKDLLANPGAAAWLVGDDEPTELHALAWLVNGALGAIGSVVRPTPTPVLDAGKPSFDLRAFEARVRDADAVVICGTNPLYSATDDSLARALAAAKESIYVGLHENETSDKCRWFVPLAHPLETWGDVRADDGTASIVQPLIDPIFGGLTIVEVLARIAGDRAPNAHEIAKDALALDDKKLDDALATGVLDAPKPPEWRGALAEDALIRAIDAWAIPPERPLEIELHPSPSVLDGRFAGVPWLLELPDPVTKLVWGNGAVISPRTAKAQGVVEGDVVRVSVADRAVSVPVVVDEGTADGVIAVSLGWGRRGAERLAHGVGSNAFPLREVAKAQAAGLAKTGETEQVPRTQLEFHLHDREHMIARIRASREARLEGTKRPPLTLYTPTSPTAPHAWNMTIDLSRCTGCSACMVACQAENNVPTVGKKGVLDDRVMHWLRIDRYETEHGSVMQPMLCQHCDSAPCEYVCPVNATVHSPDGLNEMVYNRCVGTRFCSNNCPYKVRRFNWFNYHEDDAPVRQLEYNPLVTVRARGVMEKCTFCVQRIRETEHRALVEHRDLRRDEIVTACAQACPTRAIVFGDGKDPESAVSRSYEAPEAYAVLEDLGTRPRVRYFPKVVDENPELA